MTRKTLSIRPVDERDDAPKLQKKGRGWAITDSRLDSIHELARELRRNPSPAHVALSAQLTKEDLGKFKPKAFAVIGSAIANLACQPLKLVVMITEGDVAAEIEQRRDKSLSEVGLKVVRYSAADILADPEGAGRATVAALRARYDELRAQPRAPQSRPSRPAGRGYGQTR